MTERIKFFELGEIIIYLMSDIGNHELIIQTVKAAQKKLGRWWSPSMAFAGIIFGHDQSVVFDAMKFRDLDSMLAVGYIWIDTEKMSSQQEIAKTIYHEVGHVLFSKCDKCAKRLLSEYIEKRTSLFNTLKLLGYKHNSTPEMLSDPALDTLLNSIGYPKVNIWLDGMVLDAYGLTSLNEYFATLFEHYMLGEKDKIREVSKSFPGALSSLK